MSKLSDNLAASASTVWNSYLQHPFITELARGVLPPAKFRFFLIQDYRYLLEYAKLFAVGITKATTEEEMRFFANMVHGTLNGEMQIHKAYMTRLGITQQEIFDTKSTLLNQSYTSYMLDMAQRGTIIEVLTAVLACGWSYMEIGQHLARIPGVADHPLFGEWVRGYASAAYEQETKGLINMVDSYEAAVSAERLRHLQEIFYNCSLYEQKFWDMVYDYRS